MTTEHTAQQLELAAQILRTGHPFEVRHDASDKWHASLGVNPAQAVLQNWCLRPVLATPPDNRPLHNPDNLTAEQVGMGYRLTVEGESVPGVGAEWWCRSSSAWLTSTGAYLPQRNTVRVPLSVPWPEPEKPDPYAELKAAHAAGKVIQWFNGTTWIDLINPVDPSPLWLHPAQDLRIKPEEPAFQLPPCAPGMRWHKEYGWKNGDLAQGNRPLTTLETIQKGDEFKADFSVWKKAQTNGIYNIGTAVDVGAVPFRTTRPLTFEHAGKTWTWHRPGDPMPCDGEKVLQILLSNGEANRDFARAKFWDWKSEDEESDVEIIGWRYADEKKTAPLGPEDVPPGSVLQKHDDGTYYTPLCVSTANDGVYLHDTCPFKQSYENLSEEWQINRSIPLTGKWNPDAWEPCSKTIPADDNLAEPKSR